ncbi:hypothetical protein D3C72_2183540 [compost metagenome]
MNELFHRMNAFGRRSIHRFFRQRQERSGHRFRSEFLGEHLFLVNQHIFFPRNHRFAKKVEVDTQQLGVGSRDDNVLMVDPGGQKDELPGVQEELFIAHSG